MRHLYIHVPFCARRCVYCDFSIAVRREVPGDRFIKAVLGEHELRMLRGEWDDEPVETLYLGGGTPSRLPPKHVSALVQHFLNQEPAALTVPHRPPPSPTVPHRPPPSPTVPPETTLECNPDDVTRHSAEAWVASGVNRASLGVQSFDPGVLAWMHRTHTADQSLIAVPLLRDAGVMSVSIDLIFGLPDEIGADFECDLERALTLEPDHVSVYGLSIEPKTPLARYISRGASAPCGDERYAAEFLRAHEMLTSAGYEHYEVSNYARPGHVSRHNSAYWSGRAYGSLGPSAHSFDGHTRSWNVAPWAEYDRIVAAGGNPTAGWETLTAEQQELEHVYLALRTRAGLPAAQCSALDRDAMTAAVEHGWLENYESGVRCTPLGWLRLDALTTALTTSGRGG